MNSKTENVCEGCAKRPVKKPPKRLNEKQKKYLQDLFMDGIKQWSGCNTIEGVKRLAEDRAR